LAAIEVCEAGKNWREADADVAEAIDFCEYYGREMLRLGKTQKMGNTIGELNQYFYQAKGAGVVIGPWNFPLAIPVGMAIAAVVTGNTVVLKPAHDTPIILAHFMQVIKEAKLPAGVINFLPGSGIVIGDYLVEHPDVKFKHSQDLWK
jgi:acyl-CoA reductase-like NAD-dependent aldehyde dehydrogenase